MGGYLLHVFILIIGFIGVVWIILAELQRKLHHPLYVRSNLFRAPKDERFERLETVFEQFDVFLLKSNSHQFVR